LLKDLWPKDLPIIKQCLEATIAGDFFPDWELFVLFGVERGDVARILEAWPNADDRDLDVALRCTTHY
jgi:hypothetical protein